MSSARPDGNPPMSSREILRQMVQEAQDLGLYDLGADEEIAAVDHVRHEHRRHDQGQHEGLR